MRLDDLTEKTYTLYHGTCSDVMVKTGWAPHGASMGAPMMESIEDRTFYHFTLARNVPKIKEMGLIPKRGSRSRRIKEKRDAIYLFPTIQDAEDGYSQWLMDEFSERTKLALLKVTVPHSIELFSDVPFENHIYDSIPPQCITVQSMDVGDEVTFAHLA